MSDSEQTTVNAPDYTGHIHANPYMQQAWDKLQTACLYLHGDDFKRVYSLTEQLKEIGIEFMNRDKT